MAPTLSTADVENNGDTVNEAQPSDNAQIEESTQQPHDELQYINLIKQILAKGRSTPQSI